MQNRSLFERLGGAPGIASLVDDIVDLHLNNPAISARFRPYLETPEKLALTKKHTCAFLAAGSGGPAEYTGRAMRDVHRGMNVSEAEYMAVIDDVLAALQKNGADEQTQKDCLAIVYAMKSEMGFVFGTDPWEGERGALTSITAKLP